VTDIAAACEGDGCPQCGKPLRASRGVEIGNIFKLGTRYTEAMGATFLDEAGTAHPIVMGSYASAWDGCWRVWPRSITTIKA